MQKNKRGNTAGKEIGSVVATLLEPAQAGGMPKERAEPIYEDILSYIASLDSKGRAFEDVLADLLEKWARPLLE